MPVYGKGAQTKQNVPAIKKQVNAENLPYTQNVDLQSGVKTPATSPGSYTVNTQQGPWTPVGSGLNQPAATTPAPKSKGKPQPKVTAPAADPLVQVWEPGQNLGSWGGNDTMPGSYETMRQSAAQTLLARGYKGK